MDHCQMLMFVFIDLSFPAQNSLTPYRIDDMIQFSFNGQVQSLPLKAVGEDALLLEPGDLLCATVWNDQKAVILLGETVVPSGCTLTIQKGAKVLSKPGASIDIKGTLLLTGTKAEPVQFEFKIGEFHLNSKLRFLTYKNEEPVKLSPKDLIRFLC